MADKLHFDLVSPERQLMSTDVDMVTVPGSEGDFGVLAGHAPFMSTVRPGFISVDNDGTTERLFIRGGFAEVNAGGLTILAEQAVPEAEIDHQALDQDIKNTEEDVTDAKDADAKAKAEETLEHLRQIKAGL
jgi:F-type H+-transporting ATPase subunit epsilon